MSKENPNELKIINKNERLKYVNLLSDYKKQLAELKAEITPSNKELLPQEYDNYNLADKLRYRESQVRIASEREKQYDDKIWRLEQQLKEKDDEIKNMRKTALHYRDFCITNEQEIKENNTKQVCEKIRRYDIMTNKQATSYTDYVIGLVKLLDQIKKGGNDD